MFEDFSCFLAAAGPATQDAVADAGPLFSAENVVSLLSLSLLEIVLGIDNIVFIAILVGKLPREHQDKARKIGLAMAMITRILLLLAIGWVMRLTRPLFTIPFVPGDAGALSGKDLILLFGGLFLIGKATYEIHDKLEGAEHEPQNAAAGEAGAGGLAAAAGASFAGIILQILLLDIVFSLDSVITAVGMARRIPIMITAVMVAVGVMLVFSGYISDFVHRHPTVKVLALSFLILIGVMLVSDALDKHMPKGYIYFAMAFSLGVEMLNLRLRKSKPVQLHQSYVKG